MCLRLRGMLRLFGGGSEIIKNFLNETNGLKPVANISFIPTGFALWSKEPPKVHGSGTSNKLLTCY